MEFHPKSVTAGLLAFGVRYAFDVSAKAAADAVGDKLQEYDLTLPDGVGKAGRRLAWIGWASLVGLLLALAWLHPRLDELLNGDGFHVLDRPGYRRLYRWYLALSTIQWAGAVCLTAWTIRSWRLDDSARG